ncbi:MAG: serine/threonine-protein kinase [Anaerolineae bacterium]|jgi:serine/threonine protein kinase|nr:protein kinase [Chloroflexota bacterium]
MTTPCPQCGHDVRPGARFCPRCGRLLREQLEPGTSLGEGRFRILRSISKGGMGAVYLAEDRGAFDRLCVVKQMLEYFDPGDPAERARAQQRFEEEGRILAELSHPGIPRIYAFLQEGGRFYIVMEYVRGENLAAFTTREDDRGPVAPVRRLPREEMIRYTIQVCRILEYLHNGSTPVVHQDIKPANIILEPQLGEVRLVDFGTARSRNAGSGGQPGTNDRSSIYGTAGYAPPEQYRGNPVTKSDVFALAATTYHVLTDDDPQDHPFKWPELASLPRELAAALERALRNSVDERCTAAELRQALEPMSTPQRTLEVFTFPGNVQIRTVGGLSALADEHWDAARGFLYQGDFQRWLKDINRHDLVLIADQIVAREDNQDAGLEQFLQAVDPGLAQPTISSDPPEIDLGGVARVSALSVRATLTNRTRGYVQGSVSSSEPWLEVYPPLVHLWAGIPSHLRVHVRAEDLPLRSEQRGTITVSDPQGQTLALVPVRARVSLWREVWRLVWRSLAAAIPQGWSWTRTVWQWHVQHLQALAAPFEGRPWLVALVWGILSLALGIALYTFPVEAPLVPLVGPALQTGGSALQLVLRALVVPPLLLLTTWLGAFVISLAGAGLIGSVLGGIRSWSR